MNLSISEILEMSRKLHEKNNWKFDMAYGKDYFLLMIEEIGESIEILMKIGEKSIMEDYEVRQKFVEELADILAYFTNLLNCFGIDSDEFCKSYSNKFEKNMSRDFENRKAEFRKKTVES